MPDPIYLDYNATTPIAEEVIEVMQPALRDAWGNPSSGHVFGKRARRAIDEAREQVAELIGCHADEVVFTSGGTESNNAALIGVAEALVEHGRHIVVSGIEHPAIERPAAWLEGHGWEVTTVGVDRDGCVDPADVEAVLRDDTVLLSVMHANNETGVLQPIRALAPLARTRGVIFHTDAAQSVGKLATGVDDLGVDLLTIAGHKLYAPKGVGALYVRRETPYTPVLHGAGHERGMRAGTESTAQIVGLGAACELALRELEQRRAHLEAMRDRLQRKLRDAIPDLVVHGMEADRLPNTLCAAIPGADAQRLLERTDRVAMAAGAACHQGHSKPSRVLRAMEVPRALALSTLRLTVGRSTTAEEIDTAAAEIITHAAEDRSAGPG